MPVQFALFQRLWSGLSRRRHTAFAALVLLTTALLAGLVPWRAGAVEQAEAARGPAFKVAMIMSSRDDQCYDDGRTKALRALTQKELEVINSRGGISGRPLEIVYLDDRRDEATAIANIKTALADPQTLAMIGLPGSTRAAKVFKAVGNDIKNSRIPFLSDISVNTIFAEYPNVYTTRASQDADSIPVIVTFTQQLRYAKPAFLGLKDYVGTTALGDGLRATFGDEAMVVDARISGKFNEVDANELAAAMSQIKDKKPDILFAYIGTSNLPEIIRQLTSAGITPALFVGGSLERLPKEIRGSYPNAIYSLRWDGPPDVFNDRVHTKVAAEPPAKWIFAGEKNAAAPGWQDGSCKPSEDAEENNPFESDNQRAIDTGAQYADMLGLVAAAARRADGTTDIVPLRKQILDTLGASYISGRGAYKGPYGNWSFVPKTRTAARTPFVTVIAKGLTRPQLVPIQFVRTKDGGLRQIQTLYVDVDLIKAHRVDENAKSFFAEFYLSMRDDPNTGIGKIEFANAYLDAERGGGRQISIETIHAGGQSDAYPNGMKIYKVSGRFLFNPELSNYPFDTQRFYIDLQPKSGEAPFIVQPPPPDRRDDISTTDGWTLKSQYVGYDEDFVPVVDAMTLEPSAVPFYKARFGWIVEREATDYYLRVAVPLAFIIFVAYLSIFIPKEHFEAIVTIQVTALLSAVALYLSLPALDSDTATLSDRAFVFAYMIISIMIGLSILRIMPSVGGNRNVERLLGAVHIVVIPLFIAMAAYYVHSLIELM